MAMIKVLQERLVAGKDYHRLMGLLLDLREGALRQPGYVMSETLFKGGDPITVLVIATWFSREHWKAWENSEPRMTLNDMVLSLVLEEPTTSIYSMTLEDY